VRAEGDDARTSPPAGYPAENDCMAWLEGAVERLATATSWSYHAHGASATEPAALAAMALLAAGRTDLARAPLAFLARVQSTDGSLGVTATDHEPGWPTGWAVVAWTAARAAAIEPAANSGRIDKAVSWLLGQQGKQLAPTGELGHNSMLVGWPWVADTHSWVEPTAISLLALRAAGLGTHARSLDARRLLVDRLLPEGGSNYGNTFVLGQKLRPHVLPTALSMLALAGVATDARVARSLDYLAREVSPRTTTVSLSMAVAALAAHGRSESQHDRLIERAYAQTIARDAAPYKLALVILAHYRAASPLMVLRAEKVGAEKATAETVGA